MNSNDQEIEENQMSTAMKAVPAVAPVPTEAELKELVFDSIRTAAGPAAAAYHMPHLIPIDLAGLGDLPWAWQNGTSFNAKTYNWLNNIFAYSGNGYAVTNGEALTTDYFNVLLSTAYVLDAADAAAVNSANLAAAGTVNTAIADWTTTMGAFPATVSSTQNGQLNYIMTQVLSWGAPGLTLNQLRTSANPTALLTSIPFGADGIVSTVVTYLGQTSSVANIQAAVVSFNAQLSAVRANVVPQPPLTAAIPGFMQTVDDQGLIAIVPRMDAAESNATIQNNLIPATGTGTSFSATFTATRVDTNTVNITTVTGGGANADLDFFLSVGGSTTTTTNIFSFSESQNSCQVTLTFNGVTTFTPQYFPYNVSTGFGWWNPEPIEEANNPVPKQSGYVFDPQPNFDFGVKGTFGVIQRLMISQQPVISLTYATSDYASFQKNVHQHTDWSVSFLGISLAGGSSDYYSVQTSQDSSMGTVTLTMSPTGITTPITPSDQLAYVIGAQILWPGASAAQNTAGI
jgi:hypothetical protein